MIRVALVAVGLAMLALFAMTMSCGQGVGQRCQLNRDCQQGLMCVIPGNVTPQVGGVCEPNSTNADMNAYFDFSYVDLLPPPDLAAPDLSVPSDGSTHHDLKKVD